MKTLKFNYVESKEWGGYGWLAENAPDTFEPATSMLLAHDILEHLPAFNSYTGWANELLALGAMIFIRGESGYFYQKGSRETRWEKHLGSDLAMMLERLTYDTDMHIPPLKANRLDSGIEDCLDIAINTAMEYSEVNKLPISRDLIKAYLRKGYRTARQVYKVDWQACELFRQIEEQADQLTKQAYPYLQLVVKINISKFSLKMYLEEENYDYF